MMNCRNFLFFSCWFLFLPSTPSSAPLLDTSSDGEPTVVSASSAISRSPQYVHPSNVLLNILNQAVDNRYSYSHEIAEWVEHATVAFEKAAKHRRKNVDGLLRSYRPDLRELGRKRRDAMDALQLDGSLSRDTRFVRYFLYGAWFYLLLDRWRFWKPIYRQISRWASPDFRSERDHIEHVISVILTNSDVCRDLIAEVFVTLNLNERAINDFFTRYELAVCGHHKDEIMRKYFIKHSARVTDVKPRAAGPVSFIRTGLGRVGRGVRAFFRRRR